MTSRINSPDTPADLILRKCIDNNQSFAMIAGAGSGKTTSLIKGLQYIAQKDGEKLRKQQQRIACITYTTVAEKEILNDVNGDNLFHVSTIHSFLWELVRPFQTDIKKWVISRISEKIEKLIETKNNFGPRVQERTKEKNRIDTDKYLELSEEINNVNNFRYETGSNYAKGILGHDDIIKLTPQLMNDKPLLKIILTKKYPYVFVDESQDTKEEVINALIAVDQALPDQFCLGFFGDPMQKIYTTGIGKIPVQSGWVEIIKPENFRSPKRVLDVINEIRKNGDGIEQTGGRRTIEDGKPKFLEGSGRLFILPADSSRETYINKVREFIATNNEDDYWINDSAEADLKILVIEHRMAAKRLNFNQLFSVFKDGATDATYASFSEGKHWALRPFLTFIIPLINSFDINNQFQTMELLRTFCPLFDKEYLQNKKNSSATIFLTIKETIAELYKLIRSEGSTTFKDIFQFIRARNLYTLDERITEKLDDQLIISDDESEPVSSLLDNLFSCPVLDLWGYQTYINDESVYSTQHSIKGAEFERVLIILDDEEGANSTLYSYEKLFGLKAMSDTDEKNITEGNDSVFGRTRRLLYVCCSRAKRDLAVILFVNDIEAAYDSFKTANIFPSNSIFTIGDITIK